MENKVALKRDLTCLIKKQEEFQEVSNTLQQLRYEKNELEKKIIQFLNEMDWNNKVFVFNDHKIAQKSTCQYQQLSIKFMEESLMNYVSQNNIAFNVDDFVGYLKEKRTKKQKEELKIS